MSAITDYAAFKDKLEKKQFDYSFFFNSTTVATKQPSSLWLANPVPGVAPTTSVAVDSQTTGSLIPYKGLQSVAGNLFLAQSDISASSTGGSSYMLIDRLVHSGGLNGTTTGAQSTNLPTAALTRYTDGVGVMAAVQIYTALGTTATTATISYTNQEGTSGRTSKAFVIGGTGYNEVGRFIFIPLADGDTGIQAVASINLLASTASVGAFGITLFRPLAIIPAAGLEAASRQAVVTTNYLIGGHGVIPEILDTACLGLIVFANATSTGVSIGNLSLIEG